MAKQKFALVATGLVLVACAAVAYTLEAYGLSISLGGLGGIMALTVPPSFPARGDTDQRLHTIRFRFQQSVNLASFAAGRKLCRIPNRAFIHSIKLYKTTAFNSATTDTIQLGSTAAGVDILAATTIQGVGYVDLTAAAGLGMVVANEFDLFAKYVQSGAVATAGDVSVLISYSLDDNVS